MTHTNLIRISLYSLCLISFLHASDARGEGEPRAAAPAPARDLRVADLPAAAAVGGGGIAGAFDHERIMHEMEHAGVVPGDRIRILQRAAERGDPASQFEYAQILEERPEYVPMAHDYYRRAADQGLDRAQLRYADILEAAGDLRRASEYRWLALFNFPLDADA